MRLRSAVFFLLSILLLALNARAQDHISYIKNKIVISKVTLFDPRMSPPEFSTRIINLEAPVPGGVSYRSALLEVKRALRTRQKLPADKMSVHDETLTDPLYLQGFAMSRYVELLDSVFVIPGGIPLDNTLAISNDNFLVCGINTSIVMHDLKQGSEPNKDNIMVVDFTKFARQISTNSPFDPKLIYDPIEDRFIAAFLTGRDPSNSGIILAFSNTNDPRDPWNVYLLPGNPLNNNTWTDYPAIAITDKELFLTVNLLVPGSDWKTSFSSTVIWQIDKKSGYDSTIALNTTLYSDIKLNGRHLRNLCPIQGGAWPDGPNMYFLSNRNFDPENDSIFLVEVTDVQGSNAALKISTLIADLPYGVPPNGRQANSNPDSTSDGFDTNDARILGGFLQDNTIYFVGNTAYFATKRAGVYHGIISNVSDNPTLKAHVIGDEYLDFGYPNIAFTGRDSCNSSSIISFNHTSPTDFAGTSAIRYSNGHYSKIIRLVEGENYVEKISGSYERWGDYYGLQRKYNEPGVVWAAGFYGLASKSSATWISEIRDCDCFETTIAEKGGGNNSCLGQLEANATFGIPPYSYVWKPSQVYGSSLPVNLCNYDVMVVVEDGKFCKDSLSLSKIDQLPPGNGILYPNPAVDEVNIYFELGDKAVVEIKLYTSDGRLVRSLIDPTEAKAGKNLLSFSVTPLASGAYIVKVFASDKEIFSSKVLVP